MIVTIVCAISILGMVNITSVYSINWQVCLKCAIFHCTHIYIKHDYTYQLIESHLKYKKTVMFVYIYYIAKRRIWRSTFSILISLKHNLTMHFHCMQLYQVYAIVFNIEWNCFLLLEFWFVFSKECTYVRHFTESTNVSITGGDIICISYLQLPWRCY